MIRTIIIDDEEGNIVVLRKQLEKYCPFIQVETAFTDPEAALAFLNESPPELIFLDIDMPGLNGFELLEQLNFPAPELIFVTAHTSFALKAFEYQASGYITKPVNAEKLVATVNKITQQILQKRVATGKDGLTPAGNKITLSTQKGLVFVEHDHIYYCESGGNYTNFFLTDNRQILVSKQLGQFELLLPKELFIRIHDRYIVNVNHIREYHRGAGGSVLLNNSKELPVAVRRKEQLLKRFNGEI